MGRPRDPIWDFFVVLETWANKKRKIPHVSCTACIEAHNMDPNTNPVPAILAGRAEAMHAHIMRCDHHNLKYRHEILATDNATASQASSSIPLSSSNIATPSPSSSFQGSTNKNR